MTTPIGLSLAIWFLGIILCWHLLKFTNIIIRLELTQSQLTEIFLRCNVIEKADNPVGYRFKNNQSQLLIERILDRNPEHYVKRFKVTGRITILFFATSLACLVLRANTISLVFAFMGLIAFITYCINGWLFTKRSLIYQLYQFLVDL